MSLSLALPFLDAALAAAFFNAAKEGESEQSSVVRTHLSIEIAASVARYYLTAIVKTNVEIDKLQPDLLGGKCLKSRKGAGLGKLVEAGGIGNLGKDVYDALQDAEETGKISGSSDDVIDVLSVALADAIDSYYTSVKVINLVTIFPGGTCVGAPGTTPGKPIANITSPGTGAGKGQAEIMPGSSFVLSKLIKKTYKIARDAGAAGQGVDSVVAILATGLSTAFHAYTKMVKIKTSVTTPGGQVVIGYAMITPAGAPAPLPPTVTGPGKGKGKGKIS